MSELQTPTGWIRTNLAALGEYINGFAFSERYWSKTGLPIIRIAQITGTQDVVDRFSGQLPNTFRLENGDLIFSWSGTLAVVRWNGGAAWLNQHLFKVVPARAVERLYLFHLLQKSVAEMSKRAHGSTMKHIKRGELREFSVALPNALSEQTTLAKILETIDSAIRQTEAIIEKLKQVKQGLLHDLLTRGIDVNGELRPPQSQSPQLYKKSSLGWIPSTWSVARLDQLLSNDQPAMRSGPFGSALLKSEQVKSGVPLLGIDNVHIEEFVENFTRFVPIAKFHELSRYAVRPNDLMITIMGTVGRCCLVPSNIGRALSSKHTWTITLDQTKYSPLLAMLQINYSRCILKQLARDEQGGIMSAIRSETLRNLEFPVPPIDEQIEMVERMQSITSRINTELEVFSKLSREKLGLMDDLLTGRVRVGPLLETLGM